MSTATTTEKPNRFAGSCETCGNTVPANEGILIGRMVGGSRRWLVRHHYGECNIAPRRDAETHRCLVHGPGDDECLGDRCLTGERLARQRTLPICPHHGGPLDMDGCWECNMERDEAARDREDGRGRW